MNSSDESKFLITNYRKVLASLVKKAHEGNVGAIDIVRKIVADFKAEQVAQVHRSPAPLPLSVKIGLFQMGRDTLQDKSTVLEVTTAEVEQLPEEKRQEIGNKLVVVPELPPAGQPEVVAAVEPNHRCQNRECRVEFYSRSRNVLLCENCRREKSVAKLLRYYAAKQAARAAKQVRHA